MKDPLFLWKKEFGFQDPADHQVGEHCYSSHLDCFHSSEIISNSLPVSSVSNNSLAISFFSLLCQVTCSIAELYIYLSCLQFKLCPYPDFGLCSASPVYRNLILAISFISFLSTSSISFSKLCLVLYTLYSLTTEVHSVAYVIADTCRTNTVLLGNTAKCYKDTSFGNK